jgi:7-carboxy-7-deazaguanine synthase
MSQKKKTLPTSSDSNTIKGTLIEIFSSYQGEGGSVSGSCFGKRQIFVRLAGCNLAQGAFGTKGCVWCDSESAQAYSIQTFRVEKGASTHFFSEYSNPVTPSDVMSYIDTLNTPDTHSISFTGGEPCVQKVFLIELNRLCQKRGYLTYLETNASVPWDEEFGKFDFCCADIKDRTSFASSDWKNLAIVELNFIRNYLNFPNKIFAKIVVTQDSMEEDIAWIATELAKLGKSIRICPLVIQLATAGNAPSEAKISSLMRTAALYLPKDALSISVQIHKYLKML